MYDSSRPLDGWRTCSPDLNVAIVAQLPRPLPHLPQSAADDLTAVPFSALHGMGAVFARWLQNLSDSAPELDAADAPLLASITADLLSAVLAQRVDEAKTSPEAALRVLRVSIRDYVRQRLGDPGLTLRAVAAAHRISLRRLYQIFDDDGVAPATWIRRTRLERCRRDLADPRLLSLPVRAIGARWGFGDPAHFTRVFRAAYGVPPGEYRRLSLQGE